ncbi:hypothetical protein ACFFJN_10680 [Erwinia mallotivora]|uniref:hypothetical protein n=1 Tax=Erwinia mallotivora TaxID=69222 RepID=UPI0035E8AA08
MQLTTKVFISSDNHNGFGVSSTNILGKNEAILVDAQFTLLPLPMRTGWWRKSSKLAGT